MSKQQLEMLTVSITRKNTYQDKPFIQAEGELTEEQLEAIGANDTLPNL